MRRQSPRMQAGPLRLSGGSLGFTLYKKQGEAYRGWQGGDP